jgi:hypothetical protein
MTHQACVSDAHVGEREDDVVFDGRVLIGGGELESI